MTEWTASLVRTLPLEAWRERRRANHQVLSHALTGLPWVKVLQPDEPPTTCPFSGILVFDSSYRRDYIRQRLIAERVYPAIFTLPLYPRMTDADLDDVVTAVKKVIHHSLRA